MSFYNCAGQPIIQPNRQPYKAKEFLLSIADLIIGQLAPYSDPTETEEGQPVSFGSFQLDENPDLAFAICQEIATKTDAILSFERFQKLFQLALDKPVEPQLEEMELGTPPRGVTGRQAKIWRAKQLLDAQKQYEKDTKAYSQLALQVRTLRADYMPDRGGYLAYAINALQNSGTPDLAEFFFKPTSFRISEAARLRHSFITGGTGSGKSETIKQLIRHYETKNQNTAVIVLDPHGKLAREVAQFKEHLTSDRLVFIQPGVHDGYRVGLNPFDTRDKSINGLEVQSAHLLGALEQIVDGFTLNMESLLTPVITCLLHRDGSTISDLVRFMDDKQNRDLLEYGRERLPYEEHRHFFEHVFHSQNYESTKDALQNRFQALLSKPSIKHFCGGASTFNLEQLIEDRKIIIFSFSIVNMGQQTVRVLGQLMTALIQGYCVRRANRKSGSKVRIHFFADECQYFVSRTTEEILGESRKYGLHLNLATQRTEQVGDKVLDAILGNVGAFIIGRNRGKTLSRLSRETDTSEDIIRELKVGEFVVAELGKKPVKVKVPLVGNHFAMSNQEWQQVMQNQLRQYYQLLEAKADTNGDNKSENKKALPLPDLDALANAVNLKKPDSS